MTEAKTPGLAKYAVGMIASNYGYKNDLDKGIRGIAQYTPKELEAKGITKDGKITAEGLMSYINAHIARPLLGKRNLDSQDAGFLAQFLAIKTIVERYGHDVDEVLKRVAAQYASQSTRHVGQKDITYSGTLPINEGKPGVVTLATLAGQKYALTPAIDNIKDPNDVSGVKNELEEALVAQVEAGIAAGQLEKIMKEVEGSAHPTH